MYAWLILTLAIVFEVLGTSSLKFAEGFTKPLPSFLSLVFYGLSLWCVSLALRDIELSIAYAVWAGMGLTLIALVGVVYFDEQVTALKTVSFLFILLGVVGLHVSSGQRI